MSFRVLGTRVLIKVQIAESKSPGGIIIPDSAQEKLCEGVVVDWGEEVKGIERDDVVAFGKYSGTELTARNGEKYLVMQSNEILAIYSK